MQSRDFSITLSNKGKRVEGLEKMQYMSDTELFVPVFAF